MIAQYGPGRDLRPVCGADRPPCDHAAGFPLPSLPRGDTYRALFLSDLHLGAAGSRAGMVLRFLKQMRADSVYFVGDTFDAGRMRPLHWTADDDRLLERILDMREHGTRIVRLPGNHDAGLTAGSASRVSGWAAAIGIAPRSLVHEAADGRRHLVTHGDICDSALYRSAAMAQLGSSTSWLLRNLPLGTAGRATRLMDRADMLLTRSKAMRRRLRAHAREAGFDGIVCGHLHVPALDRHDGMTYANCGDWVRNCAAVVEKADGTFILVDFADGKAARQAGAVPPARRARRFQERVA